MLVNDCKMEMQNVFGFDIVLPLKTLCFNNACCVQFTALPLNTVVQPQAQASFEYSFIPAQPMAGRPFGLVILLNYLDAEVKETL